MDMFSFLVKRCFARTKTFILNYSAQEMVMIIDSENTVSIRDMNSLSPNMNFCLTDDGATITRYGMNDIKISKRQLKQLVFLLDNKQQWLEMAQ